MKKITGEKGDFTLTLTNGESVTAEYVILAIGTQGNPNKMRCEGGDLPHIQYQLDDPGEYVDEHIMVIGSGDAGIENALGLAADPAQGNVVIDHEPQRRIRPRQAGQCRSADGGREERPGQHPVRDDAG